MIVVCIDNSITPNLTIGKKYNVIRSFSLGSDRYYEMVADNGYINGYIYYRFKLLSEVRKEKLKKI